MSENYPEIRLRPVQTPGLVYRPNSKEAEQEGLVYRQSNDDMVKYEDLLEKIGEDQPAPESPPSQDGSHSDEANGI